MKKLFRKVNLYNKGLYSKFMKIDQNKEKLKEKILKNEKIKLQKRESNSKIHYSSPSSTAVGSSSTPAKNFFDFKNIELKSMKETFSQYDKIKKIDLKSITLKNLSKHSPIVKEAKIDYYISKQLELDEKEK